MAKILSLHVYTLISIAYLILDTKCLLNISSSPEILANENSWYNQNDQSISRIDDSKLIITWTSENQSVAGNYGVYARLFSINGSNLTSEFLVSTLFFVEKQHSQALALNKGKNFVIIMKVKNKIYFKLYHSNGTNITNEVRVDNFISVKDQLKICSLEDETGFVIYWDSVNQDGSGYGTYARIYKADGTPTTNEFLVNTNTTNNQKAYDIASLNKGKKFVAVWHNKDLAPNDFTVLAKIFHSNGTNITSDILINKNTNTAQLWPTVCGLQNSFAVAWTDSGAKDGSWDGVFARIFDINGTAITDEFQVNEHTQNIQKYPKVASILDETAFVVTWMSLNQDSSGYGVYMKIFDQQGKNLTRDILVNTYVTGDQLHSVVTRAAYENSFAIAWQSFGQDDATGYGVYFKIFSIQCPSPTDYYYPANKFCLTSCNSLIFSTNNIAGVNYCVRCNNFTDSPCSNTDLRVEGYPEFQVNNFSNDQQDNQAITYLDNRRFIIAWRSQGQIIPTASSIVAQIFDSYTSKESQEFIVNNVTTFYQSLPNICSFLSRKIFVIVWSTYGPDGSMYGVFGKIYNFSGVNITSDFQINDYNLDTQFDASISTIDESSFVVVWKSVGQYGTASSIVGKIYNYDGRNSSSEIRISTENASYSYPTVLSIKNGTLFVVTWEDLIATYTFSSYARIFMADGTPLTPQFPISETNFQAKSPSVANLGNNPYFVIAYQQYGNDGSRWGIFSSLFSFEGKRLYSDVKINNFTNDDQTFVSVSDIGHGQFYVATWQSLKQDGDGSGIFARIFSINGTAVTNDIAVNQNITGNQTRPQIAKLEDEYSFVVTWVSTDQDGSKEGIFARKFRFFLCKKNEYLYQNNLSCSSNCSAQEFSPRNESGFLYCDFKCLVGEYYDLKQNICTKKCHSPYVIKNQSNHLYCDKCPSGKYFLATSDACVSNCDYPYSVINQSGILYCMSSIISAINLTNYHSQLGNMYSKVLPNENVVFTFSNGDNKIYFSILPREESTAGINLLGNLLKPQYSITIPTAENDFYILYIKASPQFLYYNHYYANGTLKSSENLIFITTAWSLDAVFMHDRSFALLYTGDSAMTYLTFFNGNNFTIPFTSNKFGMENNQLILLKDGKLVIQCAKYGNTVLYPTNPFDKSVNTTLTAFSNEPNPKLITPFTSGGFAYFTSSNSKWQVLILDTNGVLKNSIILGDSPSSIFRQNVSIASLDNDLIIACYSNGRTIEIKGIFYNSSIYFNISLTLPTSSNSITCSRQSSGFVLGYLNNDVAYAVRFLEGMYIQREYTVPCIMGQHMYYNGTCGETCNFPFVIQRIESVSLCISPCGLQKFINASNSSLDCINNCSLPFVPKNISGYLQCSFSCSSNEYYYTMNNSCILNCNFPYQARNANGNLYCDNTCKENQYVSFNGTHNFCKNYSLKVSILPASNLIYNDQGVNLSASIMTDFQNNSRNFIWLCTNFIIDSGSFPCKPSIKSYLDSISHQNSSIIFPFFYDNSNITQNYTICLEVYWTYSMSMNCTVLKVLPSYLKFSFYAYQSLYYTQTASFQVIVNQTGVSNQSISYNWTIHPNLSFISSGNILTIYPNNFPLTRNDMSIMIMVNNGPYTKSLPFYIPINQPPYNGTLSISPQDGYFLTTFYTFQTSGWNDSDLPLSYIFGYKDLEEIEHYLSTYSKLDSFQSYLPISSINSVNISIFIEVQDNFMGRARSYNFTLIKPLPSSTFLESSTMIISAILNQTNATSSQIATSLKALTDQLVSILTTSNQDTISSPCPLCSGNGVCENTICICKSGWIGTNCSINFTLADQVAQTNEFLITQIGKNLDLKDTNITNSLLDCLVDLTKNPNYNSKNILSQVTNILDYALNSTNSNITLTPDQTKKITNLLDNSFSYLSTKECNNTNISSAFLEKSGVYFDKITSSLTQSSNETSTITAKNFELNTVKVSVCDLKNYTLNSSSNLAPDLDLQFQINQEKIDCSQKVVIQYVAMNTNLIRCNSSSPIYFSTISLKVLNQTTGKSVDENEIKPIFTILFKDPGFVKCSDSCTIDGLRCVCESLSIFDIKNQLLGIFAGSQIGNLKFTNFNFYAFINLPPFWIAVFMGIATGLLIIIISKKEDFDLAASALRMRRSLSPCKKVSISLMVFHDLLVIFIKRDILPKTMRLLLYYFRTMLILSYNIIFNIKDQGIDNLWGSLAQFDFSFNPYVSVLPFLTIIPFYSLIGFLVGKAWARKSLNQSSIRKKFLLGFLLLVNAGMNLIIIVISTNLKTSAINAWIFNLIQFYFQDLLLMPPFSLILLYMEVYLIRSTILRRKNLSLLRKGINFFIDGYCALLLLEYQKEGEIITRRIVRRKNPKILKQK